MGNDEFYLKPSSNPHIRVAEGEVFLLDPIVSQRYTMNVQGFLEKKGSGLAKVSWRSGPLGLTKMTAAGLILDVGNRYRTRPEFICTILQSEQDLISDPAVRDPLFDVISLKEQGDVAPAPPSPGYMVRRNGGAKTADGNRWFAVKGDWKMLAATGAGIPDPGVFPPWDVRKYIGFTNQIESVGKLVEKYYTQFNEAVRRGNVAGRTVTLYGGRKVVAGDPETFVLLSWTPSPQVLAERPAIAKSYMLS